MEHYREQFTRKLHERLQNVQISQRDAIEVIKQRDTADTFFYLDPPYPGCNQKHYKGFTDKNLEELLVVLENIKGKFLLSNYARDVLVEKAQANDWHVLRKGMLLKVSNFHGNSRRKTEVLVCNYRPAQQEAQLFPE
jgi:DNA adenine methylase